MDNVWSIMDLIFVGAGLYALYAFVLMKTKGEITTSILLSKDVDIRKCKDIEGYKRFVMPKILIFGIGTLLYGGMGLVNTYVIPIPQVIYLVFMGLFFLLIIWFAMETKKSVKLFW